MPDPIDVSKQPLLWSEMFPGSAPSGVPDLGDSGPMPTGFHLNTHKLPSQCRHRGNPPGYTWCKDCGTRLT